jgi:hypothetical protein
MVVAQQEGKKRKASIIKTKHVKCAAHAYEGNELANFANTRADNKTSAGDYLFQPLGTQKCR